MKMQNHYETQVDTHFLFLESLDPFDIHKTSPEIHYVTLKLHCHSILCLSFLLVMVVLDILDSSYNFSSPEDISLKQLVNINLIGCLPYTRDIPRYF